MSDIASSELIQRIIFGRWREKVKAADVLAEIGSSDVVMALIPLLANQDGKIRNATALALREIRNNFAVTPLIEAIRMPENSENRSTLVYALETLDCSGHFLDVFRLALADKFDVQISALNILQEQEFLVDDYDVETAVSLLETADKDRIDYDGLVTYLEELRNG